MGVASSLFLCSGETCRHDRYGIECAKAGTQTEEALIAIVPVLPTEDMGGYIDVCGIRMRFYKRYLKSLSLSKLSSCTLRYMTERK